MTKQKYYCNPLNVDYRYQFCSSMGSEEVQIAREAADPSMIYFKGHYYIFASMTLEVWVSDDLAAWKQYRLPDELPLYDYAPDARVIGDYVYLSASSNDVNCNFYRTKDILNGPYEEIKGSFPFWDPNLFVDDDGRVYFYWGCASHTPIWGVELNPDTMQPLAERKERIWGDAYMKGYERVGDEHSVMPATEEEAELSFQEMLKMSNTKKEDYTEDFATRIKAYFRHLPYIEGAWMDKYQGKYYLQYAMPGTEFNIYGDGVYVSDCPLGPFTPARNNPYSYNPGGFLTGAGHGSTMRDVNQNLWHTATMRISKNMSMERRVGIWPAGFDADGELFCNQRYADWPMRMPTLPSDPWKNPDWYLLSFGKNTTASSFEMENAPSLAVDENVRTYWRAATPKAGEWIETDLGQPYDVHAVQVNFADDKLNVPVPGAMHLKAESSRYIDETKHVTRWILEGSTDGEEYFILKDKSNADTNLPHDFVVIEEGVQVRFVRLTVYEVPFHVQVCISGLRVFGIGNGEKPVSPKYHVKRIGDLDMEVAIESESDSNVTGYNILWGYAPDKLYHSYMIYGKDAQRIGALVKGEKYYVRVDAFNENGITEGTVTGSF